MNSSPTSFKTQSLDERPLAVVALGGNALSPPTGNQSYSVERIIVDETAARLKKLIDSGYRLLVVHGNGPQVGRLMREDISGENLDIYVSQTQGELGYLLVQGLLRAGVDDCVGVVTRSVVDEDDAGFAQPTKAVGPVLTSRPTGPSRRVGSGWRLLVGSPRPVGVVELPSIRDLITHHHVIAGGGGGIPVTSAGEPVQGVVDKDWVAALLAIELDARELVFVTDVEGVFEAFGSPEQQLIAKLSCDEAEALANRGGLGAGSMAPKVESAVRFTRHRNLSSCIVGLESLVEAIQGSAGTEVVP